MIAARSPPRSEPANSQDLRPTAIPRSTRSAVTQADAPIFEKARKDFDALEHVIYRLRYFVMSREVAPFGASFSR